MPTPAQWTNAFNPAFSYYVYYCYANLYVLNKVPFLLISSVTNFLLSTLCNMEYLFFFSFGSQRAWLPSRYGHILGRYFVSSFVLCKRFSLSVQCIFKMSTNFRLVTLTTWLLRFSHAIASHMESICESLLCFSISTTSPRFLDTTCLYLHMNYCLRISDWTFIPCLLTDWSGHVSTE